MWAEAVVVNQPPVATVQEQDRAKVVQAVQETIPILPGPQQQAQVLQVIIAVVVEVVATTQQEQVVTVQWVVAQPEQQAPQQAQQPLPIQVQAVVAQDIPVLLAEHQVPADPAY
jgi:hypothetical protein